MKVAYKTIEKIKKKGYKFSYCGGTKCFIEFINGSPFANGRRMFFNSPTDALRSIS